MGERNCTYLSPLLVLPLNKRIVHERVEDSHERVTVLTQNLEGYLAGVSVDTLNANDAERINKIVREAEWDALGSLEQLATLEQAAKIDVNHRTGVFVQQDVLGVSVSQPKDPANDAHNSERATICAPSSKPSRRFGECFEIPFVKYGWEERQDLLHVGLARSLLLGQLHPGVD